MSLPANTTSFPRRTAPLTEAVSLLLIAVVPAVLTILCHPHRPDFSWTRPVIEQVGLSTATSWGSQALWIDARNEVAYQRRHVPGAILLNEDTWQDLVPGFLAAWKPGRKIVVYCDTLQCDASTEVAVRLKRELQVTDIYVLRGGWAAWQEANPP